MVLGMGGFQPCGLGDDENGEFLLEELKQSGVNTEHVKVTAGLKSGAVPIMVDEDGERVIYVLVKGSAFEAIEPEDLSALRRDESRCALFYRSDHRGASSGGAGHSGGGQDKGQGQICIF